MNSLDDSSSEPPIYTPPITNGPGLNINSVNTVSANTYSVHGSGFTTKPQHSAILYDHGSEALENGVLNTYHKSLDDMELIKRDYQDSNTLWAKPSLPDEVNSGMRLSKNRPSRYTGDEAHYYAKGNNNFLGWPSAYGGSEINSNSKKIYTAFWIKLPFDLQNYYAIPADSSNTAFIQNGDEEYGEYIQIEGINEPGRIIAHRSDIGSLPEGWLFFEPPLGVTSRDMMGKKITGQTSGAVVTFPTNSSGRKFDEHGFLSPRGKYLRLWSSSDSNGYRYSIANLGIAGTGGSIWTNNFEYNNLIPQQWNFMEVAIDVGNLSKNKDPSLKVWINGKIYMQDTPEWIQGMKDAEPQITNKKGITIALLGVNDFMSVPFSVDLDDIYLDKSFHRVMICNKPEISQIRQGTGHCELQKIKQWTNSNIEFDLHLGALKSTDKKYLYVFDENGKSNTTGFEVTDL